MTIYVGGLRIRLIHESIFQAIEDALVELNWFDSGRRHAPINFTAEDIKDYENVTPNTAVLFNFDTREREDEMGSRLTDHRWTYFVDFFAESEAVGLHFITDVKDIVSGRMPSIGRDEPHFAVYDYTHATPEQIFYVQVENVMVDRPEAYDRPWQRFFRTCRFDILDSYGGDND